MYVYIYMYMCIQVYVCIYMYRYIYIGGVNPLILSYLATASRPSPPWCAFHIYT